MAISSPVNYYVDAAGGTDDTAAGRGASAGDPWQTIQYALDHITRDADHGDQINIKSGTAQVIPGIIDQTTYGTCTEKAQLLYRGYTSTANDGGIGEIDCDGYSLTAIPYGPDFTNYADLKIHNNISTNAMFSVRHGVVWNCELYGAEHAAVYCSTYAKVIGCYIHDAGSTAWYGAALRMYNYSHALYNYIESSVDGFTAQGAIYSQEGANHIIGNICDCTRTNANNICGMYLSGARSVVLNNSLISDGSTSTGLYVYSYRSQHVVCNNLIEGFSKGIYASEHANSYPLGIIGYNAVYNCTEAYDYDANIHYLLGEDETLDSSPFAKAGILSLADRFRYFRPVNTGNVLYGGWPVGSKTHKGAVVPKIAYGSVI